MTDGYGVGSEARRIAYVCYGETILTIRYLWHVRSTFVLRSHATDPDVRLYGGTVHE